jgi:hypothetical protein
MPTFTCAVPHLAQNAFPEANFRRPGLIAVHKRR